MNYIFKWNEGDICVPASRRKTREEVWEFAIEWLRPSNMDNDKEVEALLRQNGEVVEDID